MNKTTKKILLRYTIAPILLLVFLWLVYLQIVSRGSWKGEWEEFKSSLQPNGLWWMLPALMLAPLNWLTEAFKWQLLLNRIERIPLKRAFASVLSGMALAFITPNKTGDFLGRILFLKKKSRLRGAIASLMGSFAQIVVAFLFGLSGMIYLHLRHQASWTLPILICSGIGLGLLTYCYIHIELLSRLASKFHRLRALMVSFYIIKRYSRGELWKILGIAAIRFFIYNSQFLLLLYAFDSRIPAFSGFLLSGLMFWLITVVPTFFVADIGVRGFVTGLVFINTGIISNPFSVLAASYLIWLINGIIPSVLGSILAVGEGVFKKAKPAPIS
jgi:uncharacterized membrane protein YbhN (UPF0104 family)